MTRSVVTILNDSSIVWKGQITHNILPQQLKTYYLLPLLINQKQTSLQRFPVNHLLQVSPRQYSQTEPDNSISSR